VIKRGPPRGGAPAAPAETPAAGEASDSKIPAHLLERSKAAKARKAGAEAPAEAGAVTTAAAAAVATAAPPPAATGPGGHTQRLLTVVKSGSIQDVKATPQDKVHVWPHLLAVEFVAALAITAFTLIFSIFVNAPLLALANFNETPNPSKAPWYFLGLQELLTMFHPMVAGVTIPGMGIFLLILAPYMDRNPSNKPEDRKFAISLFTVQLMFWAVLVIIGSFFRGPGFNFVAPWTEGLFFEL
jgi:menaquinol-cytochrome c reductase cytochrome b/c subunit